MTQQCGSGSWTDRIPMSGRCSTPSLLGCPWHNLTVHLQTDLLLALPYDKAPVTEPRSVPLRYGVIVSA